MRRLSNADHVFFCFFHPCSKLFSCIYVRSSKPRSLMSSRRGEDPQGPIPCSACTRRHHHTFQVLLRGNYTVLRSSPSQAANSQRSTRLPPTLVPLLRALKHPGALFLFLILALVLACLTTCLGHRAPWRSRWRGLSSWAVSRPGCSCLRTCRASGRGSRWTGS